MTDQRVSRVVIVGGGTAGWMTAAAMVKVMSTQNLSITVIESAEIGTVGVGEATFPPIQEYNALLGIDEGDFIRSTEGTFKLGIRFDGWGGKDRSYFHPFGTYGRESGGIGFSHYFLRHARLTGQYDQGLYNIETMAARESRFNRMTPDRRILGYAYQFDAILYAAFLRKYAEARGVNRIEGKVVQVNQNPESGFVTSLVLDDGRVFEGDLFVDCSGFRGLLIEQTLKAGYENWSHWLPADSAAAVPCEKVLDAEGKPAAMVPYTVSTALEAGWQWRIPLQHRTGNGYVYSSQYISDDEAVTKLMSRLEGPAQRDPKILKFTTGHRKKMWDKNVVSMGLAAGFLEPLESTSIHLTHMAILKFLGFFPKNGFHQSVIDQFNRDILHLYVNSRDIIIAHYCVTDREDTEFWKYVKNMDIPESLKDRIDIYARTGQAYVQIDEPFSETSWFAVLTGQGIKSADYHPVADNMSDDDLRVFMNGIRMTVQKQNQGLPRHHDLLMRIAQAQPGSRAAG